MGRTQFRVTPVYQPRGMLGLALFLGALVGVVVALIESQTLTVRDGFLQSTSGAYGLLVLPTVFVLLCVLFPVLLALVTQHRGMVFLLGASSWAGMLAAAWMGMGIAGLGYPAVYMEYTAGTIAWEYAPALVGGLWALVVRWIVRESGSKLIEQDGTRCWWCGVQVPAGAPNCTQCGKYVELGQFRAAPLFWLVAIGRRIGWVGFLALLIGGAAWLARTWPDEPAKPPKAPSEVQHLGKLVPGEIWPRGTNAASIGGATPAYAAQIEVDAANGWYIKVVRPNMPRADGITLQIQLWRLMDDFIAEEWSMGAPRIMCDLNDEQAAEVLKNGVPASLSASLLQQTVLAKWMPFYTGAPPADVRIDPTPHFPKP